MLSLLGLKGLMSWTINLWIGQRLSVGSQRQTSFWKGDLFERGGLSNLVKMVVSVLHKELECKVEKLKYKKR